MKLNTFGHNLAAKRKENGMTQEDLAKVINVDRSAVAKWESGGSTPTFAKLKKLAAALNCTLDELANDKSESA